MANFTLTWTPPTTKEDGTPITEEMYYSLYEEGALIVNNIGETNFSVTVESPPNAITYQVAAVFVLGNLNGDLSDPFTLNFIKPNAPTGLTASFDG